MHSIRLVLLTASLLVGSSLLAGTALAQDDAPAEQPEQPPEQVEAQKLFAQGAELEKEKKYDEAIEKWKTAFDLFPDPGLWARIGQAYQLKGNDSNDYDDFRKAVEAYQKYLELSPEGDEATSAAINERVTQLETAIAEEDDRVKRQKDAEKQQKIADEKALRDEEERKRKDKEELEGARTALDAVVVTGLDQDTALAARLLAGGFVGWGNFALEGHLAFEGFFQLADKGVSARSLTIIDLGMRLGFGGHNFTGPFVSGGGGFGLFGGKPRERKITDAEACAGFGAPEAPDECTFDVDKNITGRLGFGYGFATGKKSTVALRLDFTYWLLSVDGNQSASNVPASRVARPQQVFSVLVGFEFMRWL